MTQLAPTTRTEAETYTDAARAFAAPHLDAAALILREAADQLRQIEEHLPAGLPERDCVSEPIALLSRYAARLEPTPPETPAGATVEITLGVARRLAVEALNTAADAAVDAIVLAWSAGMDLPIIDVRRLVEAALVQAAALTHKRALGLGLTTEEAAAEMGLQLMQARQAAVRAAQRDHVRAVDALTDIDAVRAYPAGAIWPS